MASCNKKEYCTPDTVRVFFVGFDSSEVRNIRLLKYTQGSNQTELLDSATYDMPYASSSGYFSQHGDTIYSSWSLIAPTDDYVLTVLPANRTWKITDLAYERTYHTVAASKSWPSKCPISEYHIDDQKNLKVIEQGGIMYLHR